MSEMNEDRVEELMKAATEQSAPWIRGYIDALDARRRVADDFPAVVAYYRAKVKELEGEIGKAPIGSHPDEQKPRGATSHDERQNWISEVERLRTALAAVGKGRDAAVRAIKVSAIALGFYKNCDALTLEQQTIAEVALVDPVVSAALARSGEGE